MSIIEDLKGLQDIRRYEEELKPGSTRQFVSGLGEGIATMAGAPVDIANFALKKIGYDPGVLHALGSKGITAGMRKANMVLDEDQIREGFANRAGMVAGQTLAAFVPIAGVGMRLAGAGARQGAIRAATQKAARDPLRFKNQTPRQELGAAIAGAPRNLATQMGEAMLANPGKTLAIEAGLGATAGLAGEKVARKFGEDKRIYGELAGGFSPAIGVLASKLPLTGFIKATANKAVETAKGVAAGFNPENTRRRAQQRIFQLSNNEDEMRRQLRENDIYKQFPDLAEETLQNMTTAQRYADDGLHMLEVEVRKRQDLETSKYPYAPSIDARVKYVEGAVNKDINDLIREVDTEGLIPSYGDAETHALQYMRDLVTARIQQSIEAAQNVLSNLDATPSKEEINNIVRRYIDESLRDIRSQEDAFWKSPSIKSAKKLSTENAKKEFATILADTSTAQMDSIPEKAMMFLDKPRDIPTGKGVTKGEIKAIKKHNAILWGDEQTIFEMQGLRSALGETEAEARIAGKSNTNRIAKNLRDALLKDMGAKEDKLTGPEGRAIRQAIDFSRNLNETFYQGPMARILGTSKAGEMTPRSLTLEQFSRKKGLDAKHHIISLLNAGRSKDGLTQPWNAEVNRESTDKIRERIKQYIINQFKETALEGDVLKGAGHKSFMNKYKEVLDDSQFFPGLKEQFEKTIRSGSFIQSDEVISKIVNSADPVKALNDQLSILPADRVKANKQSLALTLIDRILLGTNIASGRLDIDKVPQVIQGQDALERVSNPRIAKLLEELLTDEQLNRLKRIATIMQRIQYKPPQEIRKLIEDPHATVFQIVGMVIGARLGSLITKVPLGPLPASGNIQTPGLISAQAKRLAGKIKDPADRLLIEAVLNADVFKMIMEPIVEVKGGVRTQIPEKVRTLNKKIEAWMLGILADLDEPDDGF